MLNDFVLRALSSITEEERTLLEGSEKIDRSLYMEGSGDVISGRKLLQPPS